MTEDVVAGELTRPIATQRERKPDRLAGDGMARVDAVAGRVDVLVGGSQVVVHRDRPGGAERKPRSRCQLGLGSNAGRDQHQIGLERRVGGLHGGARAGSLDRLDPRPDQHLDPVRLGLVDDTRPQRLGQPGQDLGQGLHHGYRGAHLPEVLGRFQPDVADADDYHSPYSLHAPDRCWPVPASMVAAGWTTDKVMATA